MEVKDEVSFRDVIITLKKFTNFLLKNWVIIAATVVVFGIAGILFATYQKPFYIAELTFAPESDNTAGMGKRSIIHKLFQIRSFFPGN